MLVHDAFTAVVEHPSEDILQQTDEYLLLCRDVQAVEEIWCVYGDRAL